MAKKKLSQAKAKEMLHNPPHGKPLTEKQRKFFGAVAGGATPYAQNGVASHMDGLTDKGFNYNGAWGGPSMQKGGVLTFLEPTSKKLPAGYNFTTNSSSTEYATSIGGEDGEPAYLIPTFKYGELLYDPKAEFRRTGEHLGGPFKTWQEADKWDQEVRHPYVEKGQSIPTPLKRWGDMAMGGSLPGATGMMYARVGAPSKGPRGKKTLASAQNGKEMKFYQEGLDFTPKTISRDGSIIKDDMGQWAHPGEITEIQGDTMATHGYGDIPLYVIPDNGEPRIIEPNTGTQTFPGATKFTEYPIMQKGGRTPIYVDTPNDPRLKAYQDSLSLYNKGVNDKKEYLNYLKTLGLDLSRMASGPAISKFKKIKPTQNTALKSIGSVSKLQNDGSYSRHDVYYSTTGTDVNVNKEIHDKIYKGYDTYKKPVQPVEYRKPEGDKFGLTKEDYISARKNKFIPTPGSDKGDGYFELKKNGQVYKVYSESGGNSWVDVPQKSAAPKKVSPETLYVDNPNDPRLRSYSDSAALYQRYNIPGKKHYMNIPISQQNDYKALTNIGTDPMLASKLVMQDNNRLKNYWTKDNIQPIGYNYDKVDNNGYHLPVYKKPVQPVVYKQPKQRLVNHFEPVHTADPVVNMPSFARNVYEGSPVYSPGVGSGLPSTLVGFVNQGDTTYIKPEDYERFAVPKYGKEYIESKTTSKKKNGGWLSKYE